MLQICGKELGSGVGRRRWQKAQRQEWMKYRNPSQNVENDASQTRRGGMIMFWPAGCLKIGEEFGRVALSSRVVAW